MTPIEILTPIRAKYPTPLGDQLPTFLIEAAKAVPDAGLLAKPAGNRQVVIIDGAAVSVAGDILAFRDGHIYDFLIDQEGEGKVTWQDKGFVESSRYVHVGDHNAPGSPTVTPGATIDLEAVGMVIRNAIAPLEASNEVLRGIAENLQNRVGSLEAQIASASSAISRIDAFLALPWSVEGSTSISAFHNHRVNLTIKKGS